MKIPLTKSIFSARQRKRKKPGFALIATLTLMMLLAMLAVALLSMASTQQRIAMQTVLLAEARQQALVGLDVAIGELQVELGADQRVSANSGILSDQEGSFPQYILGVWESWDGPLYGDSPRNLANNIQATYTKGREKMFRRWMVSSRDKTNIRRLSAAREVANRRPGQRICMVGEGTLGKNFSPQHHIYADLLEMPAHGKNKACFAWWIGGENQKAKVNIALRDEPEDLMEVLRRTWDTPTPMFLNNSDLDFLPKKIEQPDKIITLGSLPLLGTSSQNAGMPYFFDVTTSSYSLPTNVRTGGFKHDLCLLLNKDSLQGTEFAARRDQDCPIVEDNDLPKGSEQKMPIGSWQDLFAYYNCWPDGSANDSSNFTARLIGEVEKCYTRMSGAGYKDQDPGSVTDNLEALANGVTGTVFEGRAMMDRGSRFAGYARTPVMLAYLCTFGLVTAEHPQGYKSSDGQKIYELSVCFSPMFLWWNPYNVPMRIRGHQLWSQSLPYKATMMQTYAFPQTRPVRNWDDYEWGIRGISKKDLGVDLGDFFQNALGDKYGDIVFNPGEILFFSPAKSRKYADSKQTNPWVLGYNPSSVSGYLAKVYHHDSPNFDSTKTLGTATENNIRADRFVLKMRLGGGKVDGSIVTNGETFAPNRAEVFAVMSGYNSMGEITESGGVGGLRGLSPHRGMLGWYNPDDTDLHPLFCDGTRNAAVWSVDGSQSDDTIPYFIAAVGIVPKSANMNLDKHIFPGQDYRTKSWQHSSPAFWGSMIVKPDHQQRQYHPYQLAAMDVGGGISASPMDCIGRNGVLGINGDGEQVSFASVLELPVHPPFSLAGFAGMRLQPGWYDTGRSGKYSTEAAMRRMQYQAGIPGVGIGNSFADPCLPAGDVYAFHRNNIPTEIGNSQLFSDFYDHGLLINDALWDRWFCSSVSDMPSGSHKIDARDVMAEFLSGKKDLPVSRYKKVSTPYNDSNIIARLIAKDGWKHIAQYLMIDGGFNVNSTSVEAWTAVLQGLARRKLVTGDGNKLKEVEANKGEDQVLFSRFMLSTTDKSVDSLGGYSMRQGSSQFRDGSAVLSAWGEVRKLEPESIRKLAEEMVKQVRKRGPFLNMSDFINRRLETAGGENALKGALQAAIDATDINRDFQEVIVKAQSGNTYKFPEAENGSMYTAAPGYLIQSDVLASLGNVLTVRDDTFTVRAYGCVRSPRNAILAQAWCEAVVQRTMDYVDPANKPSDAEYKPDGTRAGGLSDANKVLGRQFRIVSFKWLDLWDI